MDIEKIKEIFPEYDKKMNKACIDLKGQVFNRLTVLYRSISNTKGGQAMWICQCSCGKVKPIRGSSLRNGKAQSCGCLTYENASKSNINNLIGQTFGKLTVIKDTKRRSNHYVIWKCKCECGNYVDRVSNTLVQGDSFSCGCCNCSKGSVIIENLLKAHNIDYEKEKKFPDLLGKNKMPLRYDFYLPEYNRLIEFDGIQHFKEREIFRDSLKEIQQRDIIKNNYALKNNIQLVRIPYWKENNITIEMLLGDIFLLGD